MSFSEGDLHLLDLVFDLKSLKGTAYFELHPGDLPSKSPVWLPGSLFMRDLGFDFFVQCFAEANPAFDYFGFERFDPGQVARLTATLSAFAAGLQRGATRETVFSFFNPMLPPSSWDTVNTESLREALRSSAAGILGFLHERVRPTDSLWVMGI